MGQRLKAALYSLLGLAVLVALIAYVGPSHIASAVRNASPLFLGLAVGSYALFFLLRGIRWRILLASSAPGVRLSSTVSTTAVGWLANSILPLKGGDVLRAALLARREKVGLAVSAATVGLERVLDLIGLAVLATIGLLLLPQATQLPEGAARALAVAAMLPLLALATLALLVRWRLRTVELAARLMRPFGTLGRKLVLFGDSVLVGLGTLAKRPALMGLLGPLTLMISTAQALIFTFFVMAFLRADLPLAFSGSTIFLLSFVVSITPGNVGTYEAAFAAVFIALGLAPEAVVPAAILTHLATTLTVAIMGGIGLAALGLYGAPTLRPAAAPPTEAPR